MSGLHAILLKITKFYIIIFINIYLDFFTEDSCGRLYVHVICDVACNDGVLKTKNWVFGRTELFSRFFSQYSIMCTASFFGMGKILYLMI